MFELAMVNEPSVFEPSRFDCNLSSAELAQTVLKIKVALARAAGNIHIILYFCLVYWYGRLLQKIL